MNKETLVAAMAAEMGSSRREAQAAVEALVKVITGSLIRHESVCISNFLSLAVEATSSKLPSEVRRHARRDAMMHNPAQLRVRVKPSPKLLEAVRSGTLDLTIRKSYGRSGSLVENQNRKP